MTSFDGKYVLADQPSQKTQSNLVLMGAENPRTVLLSLQLRAVKMLYGYFLWSVRARVQAKPFKLTLSHTKKVNFILSYRVMYNSISSNNHHYYYYYYFIAYEQW